MSGTNKVFSFIASAETQVRAALHVGIPADGIQAGERGTDEGEPMRGTSAAQLLRGIAASGMRRKWWRLVSDSSGRNRSLCPRRFNATQSWRLNSGHGYYRPAHGDDYLSVSAMCSNQPYDKSKLDDRNGSNPAPMKMETCRSARILTSVG